MPFCLDLFSSSNCFSYTDRNWFVIGSWRLLFFPLSPSSTVCVLFISPMKIKLGSSCTGGMYLFLTPVKSRRLVGEGENRETGSILYGKMRLLGHVTFIEKHLPDVQHQHRHARLFLILKHSRMIIISHHSQHFSFLSLAISADSSLLLCVDIIL